MRFITGLLTAAVLFVASTLPARADVVDVYEFIVSNFDGYGSSATFYLPSSIPNIDQYQGDLFATSAVVNLTFEPGAPVFAYFGNTNLYYATSPVYESQEMDMGFTDRYNQGPNFAVGPNVQVAQPEYDFYTPSVVVMGNTPDLFTMSDDVATFELGTFPLDIDEGSDGTVVGSVTIVNTAPEPSTFVLLGTGVLGLAGVVRRKLLSQ